MIVSLAINTPRGLEAAQADTSGCASELCRLASAGRLEDLRWPDFLDYRRRIQSFYEPTGYAFAWIDGGEASAAAKSMIEVFQEAESKGLNPEDYDGSRWADRLRALGAEKGGKSDASAIQMDPARFDLALTICVMRYVSDLHSGKANPGVWDSTFDLDRERNDLVDVVRDRLLHVPDVNAVLDGIEPPYEGYRRTEAVLQQYLAMSHQAASAKNEFAPLPLTAKPVDPGKAYPAAAQLAGILRQFGDLPADAALPADSTLYAGALVDAVKHFQARHGLDTDGRLGKATVAALNTPVSRRIRQLELTLERWRWVPRNFPVPPVVVNIPEFELRALDRDYHTELEMKVVVGKAFSHQTPVFSAEMNSVGFWPYWDVPVSIQRAELVPKLAHDPAYLAKNNFEVVTVKREVVSTGDVDDALLARLRSLELRIRQVPGPTNSLGLIKFVFPNQYDVYMHDTPATELFARSRRDFSHGCIRLEKPEQLAVWALREKPEWTSERIHDAIQGGNTFEVKLDRPIPVLIVYGTAVVLANGGVRFLEDIYGLDAQLEQILDKGYPYPTRKITSDARDPRRRE
jgi:murein L,D-transpeptidase YcbB/YkuD